MVVPSNDIVASLKKGLFRFQVEVKVHACSAVSPPVRISTHRQKSSGKIQLPRINRFSGRVATSPLLALQAKKKERRKKQL
jgi:hypothetical protein